MVDIKLHSKKKNRETGNKGEDIACFYLEKHGFLIQGRNYLKKWGEIDIIAVKDGILHFIEVKSVIDKGNANGNSKSDGYRPEENVTFVKQKKLRRIIQTYIAENKYGFDREFKFHIITVRMNSGTGKFLVKMLENIIL